jgi:hypothetical protein
MLASGRTRRKKVAGCTESPIGPRVGARGRQRIEGEALIRRPVRERSPSLPSTISTRDTYCSDCLLASRRFSHNLYLMGWSGWVGGGFFEDEGGRGRTRDDEGLGDWSDVEAGWSDGGREGGREGSHGVPRMLMNPSRRLSLHS